MIGKLLLLILGLEAGLQVRENIERRTYYNLAREYCNSVGKPLLRVGMRRSPLEPPNGDVTIDIDPAVQEIEGGVWGDERGMPFGDKEFGIAFNEHTLEHLSSPEDVQLAVNECVRVADKAIFLAPSPYSLMGIFHPTHHLRLWFDTVNSQIRVVGNEYRIGQVMVVSDSAPEIVAFEGGFLIV